MTSPLRRQAPTSLLIAAGLAALALGCGGSREAEQKALKTGAAAPPTTAPQPTTAPTTEVEPTARWANQADENCRTLLDEIPADVDTRKETKAYLTRDLPDILARWLRRMRAAAPPEGNESAVAATLGLYERAFTLYTRSAVIFYGLEDESDPAAFRKTLARNQRLVARADGLRDRANVRMRGLGAHYCADEIFAKLF